MSLFQLYETNKEKYRILKLGTILRYKDYHSILMRINYTNWEDDISNVSSMDRISIIQPEAIDLANSFILEYYEPCEDT